MEQDRPDVKLKRRSWWRRIRRISNDRLVFLDESGAKTNMVKQRGWAPNGERLVDATPGGHWKTTTMISAIRLSGVATAMVTEGPMNGLVFRGFTQYFLVPALKEGDIVVMDNLSSHKTKRAIEMIESAGAQVWYLPPYSPDFNPIEQMWSKVKSTLCSLARRTMAALHRAVGIAINKVDAEECKNYFINCGYPAT